MTNYRATVFVPSLVERAQGLAAAHGFEHACTPETGRFLHLLTATIGGGSVAELGSGTGVGAAWIASALQPSVNFVTVELDPDRATLARKTLQSTPGATVLTGDWRDALAHGPFNLIFVDASDAKLNGKPEILGALQPGGLIILDDFTPEEFWPAEWRGKPDELRELWLNDPDLRAGEIRVAREQAVIVGVKVYDKSG